MNDNHREAFREEARELLGELEAALLELEKTPEDLELIGRVFRAMHTIKGSGAMFGFDEIAAFTHDVETIYDRVRNGDIRVTKHLVDLTLSACDQIQRMIEPAENGEPIDREKTKKITAAFKDLLDNDAKPNVPDPAPPSSSARGAAGPSGKNATYRIRFRPARDMFASGTNPVLLLNELRALGTCTVIAHTNLIPDLEEIDPEACYTCWDILLTTKRGINAIRDVFIFVEDDCDLKVDVIDEEGFENDEVAYKRLGQILVERGDLTPESIEKTVGAHKRIGELLVDAGLVGPEKIQSALVEQALIRETRQKRAAVESSASIRVPAEKLDTLVNMVGELVTIQSRLSQTAASLNDPDLLLVAEEVERLTVELRDNTMSIRMLPIGTTFSKFQRLVRDLSRELGKEIALTTEGAETELDKTVIERLNDPLVHLIRNSIDHGIELPDLRRARGKPSQGTVHLSASHSGTNVLLQIRDDGAGLDKERIREKAVERGLIAPDAVLTDKEIFSLIFLPGFSTRRKVTNVSGRGVGMDVVKRGIDALQGSIDVTSTRGTGTTITLKLPLTLAIIDGLLVRIEEAYFVLPLSAVDECVELTRKDVANAHGQNLAMIRGELVPYLRLRQRFRMGGTPPEIEQIVTTQFDGYRVGLVVDQVIGEHQTVIKSLGRAYRNVEDVSGATILGDGKVALILDLPKLIQKTELEEKARHQHGGTH